MTNKTLRDYINLVENAQREALAEGVAEAEKKPHPKTWHDVDPKLGKAVDKMSQAEKVKKGLAHPDTLKKKGVAEGSDNIEQIKAKIRELEAEQEENKYGSFAYDSVDAELQFLYGKLDKIKKQGVAEDQLEETSPDAIEKIEQLVRK